MAGPERIDRFEVEALLGAGGFATVWLARDPVLDLRVAIKVLADNWSRDGDIRRRFIEEARVLWQANSPRIVRVHHVDELPDGRPYFVMTWADRGTLRGRMDHRFEAGARFSPSEACAITAELGRAVADVHDVGRIHRDIKPGNVLIRSTERRRPEPTHGLAEDEQLVLADFGLAREIDASAITLVSGSPAYVAPEQAGGLDQLSERADLYPLGLIAVELLTGSSPCRRATMADAAMTGELDIATHLRSAGVAVPAELESFLGRMTHPDPEQRPPSADRVASVLSTFAQRLGGRAGSAPTPPADRASTVVQPQSPTVAGGPPARPGAAVGPPSPDSPADSPADSPDPGPGSGPLPPVPASALALGIVGDASKVATPPGATGPNGHPGVVNPVVGNPTGGMPSGEPAIAGPGAAGFERSGRSRIPLILGAVVVAAVALAGVTALTLRGDDPLITTAPSSTTSPSTTSSTDTSASTTAPSADTDPAALDTLAVADDPEAVRIPLPDRSVVKDDDAVRTLANVARGVDDLVAFYRAVDDPAWTIGEVAVTDGVARFDMTGSDRIAAVTISPTAQGAGDGISEIEALYRPG